MKKKIFFLADSVVDLRFIYNELNNVYVLKWVYYHKSLKKEFFSLGYKKKDLIYLSSNFFEKIFKKIFNILISKKIDYREELNKKIIEIDKKFKPDMWITDTGDILSSLKLKSIKSTFKHSVPYKKYFLQKNIFDYDYVFIPGNYHLDRIRSYYHKNIDELNKKLIITISPKILPYIILKKEIMNKKKVFQNLNLENNRNTIVLATTHNSFNSSRILPENFGPELGALTKISEIITKKYQFNLIIKPHHYHFNKFDKNEYSNLIRQKNISIFKPNKHFDSLDSEILFFNSDIIITDTSGVASTCSYLDKKLIYLNPDNQDWENCDIEKNLRPGFVINSINELDQSIKKYLEFPDLFSKERSEFRNKIFKYQNISDLSKIREIIKNIL